MINASVLTATPAVVVVCIVVCKNSVQKLKAFLLDISFIDLHFRGFLLTTNSFDFLCEIQQMA
jgi:hypothetical protein